ncbi:MAG: hypothetical protein AAFR75_03420 [Pseudomonadota bacterium]
MSSLKNVAKPGSGYANEIPMYLPPGISGHGAMASMFRGIARYQLELWALTSRRGQAYMEYSLRLARCKSPDDYSKAQQRFSETAFKQYKEASERLTDAWTQVVSMPSPAAVTEAEVNEPLVFSPIPPNSQTSETERKADRVVPRRVSREDVRRVA